MDIKFEYYFDWLPDELLYIICTLLGPNYNHLYNYNCEKLDKAYKNFIDDVTSGIIFTFKLFHQSDLKFYRNVGTDGHQDYIELSMKKSDNALTEEVVKRHERRFNSQLYDIPLEIIEEIKDLKFVIYADYTYRRIQGIDREQMTVVYINSNDEYVLWEFTGELPVKEVYTNINWKMIWTKLLKIHQDNILEIDGYKI